MNQDGVVPLRNLKLMGLPFKDFFEPIVDEKLIFPFFQKVDVDLSIL